MAVGHYSPSKGHKLRYIVGQMHDGIEWLEKFDDTVDLLYVDADGRGGKGKSIYYEVVEAAMHALKPGSLVVTHNSVNSGSELTDFFSVVRDESKFRQSVNVFIDDQGIEVSVK